MRGGITKTITPNDITQMLGIGQITPLDAFVIIKGVRQYYKAEWRLYEFGDFSSQYLLNKTSLASLGKLAANNLKQPIGKAAIIDDQIYITQSDKIFSLVSDSRAFCMAEGLSLILDFSLAHKHLGIFYNQSLDS